MKFIKRYGLNVTVSKTLTRNRSKKGNNMHFMHNSVYYLHWSDGWEGLNKFQYVVVTEIWTLNVVARTNLTRILK